MEKFGIGQGVLREEDPRLLRGNGLFVNDVDLPGQAHAVVLRSPHAHADILGIDTSAALDLPGVLEIYTGGDIAADNLGVPGMPAKWLRPDGQPMKYRPQPPLALGWAVGDETLETSASAPPLLLPKARPGRDRRPAFRYGRRPDQDRRARRGFAGWSTAPWPRH